MVDQKDTNSTIATLALVVAVAALAISWIAYNKHAGPDLEDKAVIETKEAVEVMDKAADKAEPGVREVTGDAMQSAGKATTEAGKDVKDDSEDNNQ